MSQGSMAITSLHSMLKEEVSGEVGFLHVSKHQCSYKLILSFSMGLARRAQSTLTSFQYLCDISRKQLGMKLSFCMHHVNITVFNKLILSF